MIESSFSESDRIGKVYEFLDRCLDQEVVKGKSVVIFTAPPKVEYRRDDSKVNAKSLRELGLIPSAVVSLRWSDPAMNGKFPLSFLGFSSIGILGEARVCSLKWYR